MAYLADQNTDEVFQLYVSTITGSLNFPVNGALVSGGDVTNWFNISPNSNYVYYLADQETDEKYELYVSYYERKLFLPLVERK